MESYPPTLGVTLYSARMFGFRIVALLTLVTTMFHLQNDPAGAAATTRMLTKRRLARQTADGTTCACFNYPLIGGEGGAPPYNLHRPFPSGILTTKFEKGLFCQMEHHSCKVHNFYSKLILRPLKLFDMEKIAIHKSSVIVILALSFKKHYF